MVSVVKNLGSVLVKMLKQDENRRLTSINVSLKSGTNLLCVFGYRFKYVFYYLILNENWNLFLF